MKRCFKIFVPLGIIWLNIANAQSFHETKLTASDSAAGDCFGWSVSLSGDYAIIGAYRDSPKGSAYIFKYDYCGKEWIEQAKLTETPINDGSNFGCSVSILDDCAVVGKQRDGPGFRGAAFIFRRYGETWIQEAKLTPDPREYGEYFGNSVSISGDYTIIGALRSNKVGRDSGAAYIFKYNGSDWIQQVMLTPIDSTVDARFGRSVSISGDYAIIGTPWDDDKGDKSGSAYIYKRNGTSWSMQVKLTASDGDSGDWFGWSVSLSGDYAIIGAHEKGAAYIFKRDGTNWIQQTKLTASGRFGFDVSLTDSSAIIGAPFDSEKGRQSGSAYIFKRDGENWIQHAKLIASDGMIVDMFGNSVSISGDAIIVGAPYSGSTDTGAAYIYSDTTTSVLVKTTSLPKEFDLAQNYPNPFNSITVIKFTIPENSYVEIKIYDILGKKVRTLLSTKKASGSFKVIWDGKTDLGYPVTSGIYIYKIFADNFQDMRKMILIK